MIETTLGEAVNREPVLRRISEQDGMSEKTKYSVTKLSRLVEQESRIFGERRLALFTELGVERDARSDAERRMHGATLWEIRTENLPEYQKRLAELMAITVKIDWAPLRSVDLPQSKPSDRLDLGPFCELVDPDETQKP